MTTLAEYEAACKAASDALYSAIAEQGLAEVFYAPLAGECPIDPRVEVVLDNYRAAMALAACLYTPE